jgi:hypothetical protein
MHVLAYTLHNVNLKCILIEYDKGMVSLKYLLVWNSRIIRRVTKEFWVTSLAFGVYLMYFSRLFLMGCLVVCQLYFCRFLYTWRPRMCGVRPLLSITTCDNFFSCFSMKETKKTEALKKAELPSEEASCFLNAYQCRHFFFLETTQKHQRKNCTR